MIDSGESPEEIVKKEGLGRVDSREGLESVVSEVLAENSEAVADYRAGNTDTLNFLMGKVMQKMRGRADAGTVIMILKKKL